MFKADDVLRHFDAALEKHETEGPNLLDAFEALHDLRARFSVAVTALTTIHNAEGVPKNVKDYASSCFEWCTRPDDTDHDASPN